MRSGFRVRRTVITARCIGRLARHGWHPAVANGVALGALSGQDYNASRAAQGIVDCLMGFSQLSLHSQVVRTMAPDPGTQIE